MDNYQIFHPFLGEPLKDGFLELEITSENLNYAEIGTEGYGLQCNSLENRQVIIEKCNQVTDLIREIDKLNVA